MQIPKHWFFEVWPYHPPPRPFESFSGYLIRLFERNGMSDLSLIQMWTGIVFNSRRHRLIEYPPEGSFGALPKISMCSLEQLRQTTLFHLFRKFAIPITNKISPYNFLAGSVSDYLRLCSLCFIEDGYYSLVPRFLSLEGCSKHGWLDKARRHLDKAESDMETLTGYSEIIQASQECIELSVKAVLKLLNIQFSKSHEWKPDSKEFANIAKEIKDGKVLNKLANAHLRHINLPRLLLLMHFWGQFYSVAKYGYEAENLATANELFGKEEAEIAIHHARECHQIANQLRFLPDQELAQIAK